MNLSSATLFHFTKEFEYLKSILEFGFYPRYCMENIQSVDRNSGVKKKIKKAIPMVCFCDIPLSQVKNHIEFYGNYGIGLKKSWGQSAGLNPLLYLDKNSLLSDHLVELSNEIFTEDKKDKPEHKKLKKAYHEIIRYTKPYRGENFDRNTSKVIEDYIFYNEREWRFVPQISDNEEIPIYLKEDEFNSTDYKNKCNECMKECGLKFELSDISYLIVQHDFEIARIIEFIEKCNFKYSETKLLISKIQTKEQIMQDF